MKEYLMLRYPMASQAIAFYDVIEQGGDRGWSSTLPQG